MKDIQFMEYTVHELCESYPDAREILSEFGLSEMVNSPQFSVMAKRITVAQMIKMKNLNAVEVKDRLMSVCQTDDQTQPVTVSGLLPCPVRLPLLEAFDAFIEENGLNVKTSLQAASMGTVAMEDMVRGATEVDQLPDILISAGFDLFFDPMVQKRWIDTGIYTFQSPFERMNEDFEKVSLGDPDHKYGMISVVPAVFMVNKEVLGDLPVPRSWADLLNGTYKGLVSLPIEDFDLFNAILIHLEERYGVEGVMALKEALFDSMHPAQMVKSADKRRGSRPGITVLPYFFTRTVREGTPLQAIWPEEGALVSPIFILVKKSDRADIQACSDFLASAKVGEILAHKGLFPSAHPDVDNRLDDEKTFWWIGWDKLRESNIQEKITSLTVHFTKDEGGMEV